MPTGYAAHTAHYSIGAGNKGPGIETDIKDPTSKMKDKRYIAPFPRCFVQGEFTFTYC